MFKEKSNGFSLTDSLAMTAAIVCLFVIACSVAIGQCAPVITDDPLMKVLGGMNYDENSNLAPQSRARMIQIIEYMIKYVTKIKSSDKFIDNVLSRQQGPMGKMNILTFLYRCFRLAQSAIERDLSQMLDPLNKKPTSLISSTLTVEQLQKAQLQLNDLQHTIKKRIDLLQNWMPPTIPFLGV